MDIRPFLFAFGLLAAVILIVGYRIIAGRWPQGGFVAASFAIGMALFLLAFYGVFDYHRQVTHQMRWRVGEPDVKSKQMRLVLTFRDYPGYSIDIYSDEVARYLKTLSTSEVPVVFDVTFDFGRVRGFHEVRIGQLTSWRSPEFEYFGVHGAPSKSPF